MKNYDLLNEKKSSPWKKVGIIIVIMVVLGVISEELFKQQPTQKNVTDTVVPSNTQTNITEDLEVIDNLNKAEKIINSPEAKTGKIIRITTIPAKGMTSSQLVEPKQLKNWKDVQIKQLYNNMQKALRFSDNQKSRLEKIKTQLNATAYGIIINNKKFAVLTIDGLDTILQTVAGIKGNQIIFIESTKLGNKNNSLILKVVKDKINEIWGINGEIIKCSTAAN